MKTAHLTIVGLIIIAAVTAARVAHAITLDNSGNAAGSNNTIDLKWNQSTSVNQSNDGSVNNDIDAGANTGGNSGSANTGDATTDVNVNNRFNVNDANVTCCPEGKASPTPKPPKPGESPTPTPTAGVGGPPSGDGDGGNGGGNGGGGGVGGGGEVIGISAAAGENYTEIAFTASGIVCLLAGAYLTRKNHLAM